MSLAGGGGGTHFFNPYLLLTPPTKAVTPGPASPHSDRGPTHGRCERCLGARWLFIPPTPSYLLSPLDGLFNTGNKGQSAPSTGLALRQRGWEGRGQRGGPRPWGHAQLRGTSAPSAAGKAPARPAWQGRMNWEATERVAGQGGDHDTPHPVPSARVGISPSTHHLHLSQGSAPSSPLGTQGPSATCWGHSTYPHSTHGCLAGAAPLAGPAFTRGWGTQRVAWSSCGTRICHQPAVAMLCTPHPSSTAGFAHNWALCP